ncbi:MAG: glycoside hydrolase family 127 protein [Phycisphaerae bacterium]|nr:glycoside hydrolase family 127 protein [Phycisphaerae bacterium]
MVCSVGGVLVWLGSLLAGSMPAHAEKAGPMMEVVRGAHFEFGGVVGDRIEANLRQWLLIAPDANPGMTEMFRVRDRRPVPELVPWAGEFVGKYLLSAIQARRMTRAQELDRLVRRIVDELIAAQDSDGYLGPFRRSERLLGQWDLWGHYHLMLALLMYHQDSGYPPAMDAACKAADLVCSTYLDTGRRIFDAGSHEMNMAVIHSLGQLYRATGREPYLRMMRHIEEDWQRAGDYLRTGLAGAKFYLTPRPRWESLHDLQGLVELHLITGQPEYRQAFLHHWRSIARYDRHNNGAFSTGEGAVGNPYRAGAIETCCTVAWMAITLDALALTGDPAVADELEWSLFNAMLGAQHPTGRWWTYDTPMDGFRSASAHAIVFQARAGTPELNCCSVNGPRSLGMTSEWAVMLDKQGPVLNYYGPCRVTLRDVAETSLTLTEETRYPAEAQVRIAVDPARPATFALRLRIPGWSKRTLLSVNGREIEGVRAGSYAAVTREWKAGDTIDLALDMSPRYWRGEAEKAGMASIFRGPLLLACDQHFNSFDPDAAPVVDLEKLSLRPVAVTDRFPPIVLFDQPAADGTLIRLCDYATAGAHGTHYRSWLPATNARPTEPFLKQDCLVLAEGEERIIIDAALDGSGEPRRGCLLDATGIQPASDRVDRASGAVELDGRSSRLRYELPCFPEEGYTICVWVYLNEYSAKAYQQVFSAWTGGGDDPLRLSVMGEAVCARIEAQRTYSTAAVPIAKRQWIHLAVSKSGGKLDLYVNGEKKASAEVPAKVTSRSRCVALGANPLFAGDEYFSGRLDGFAFYARPLSSEQIEQHLRIDGLR